MGGPMPKGRKRLLQKNGYVYYPDHKTWVGPGGKTIKEVEAHYNLEVWLENKIRQQQGQVIR